MKLRAKLSLLNRTTYLAQNIVLSTVQYRKLTMISQEFFFHWKNILFFLSDCNPTLVLDLILLLSVLCNEQYNLKYNKRRFIRICNQIYILWKKIENMSQYKSYRYHF
jgi:hypothetical protein